MQSPGCHKPVRFRELIDRAVLDKFIFIINVAHKTHLSVFFFKFKCYYYYRLITYITIDK